MRSSAYQFIVFVGSDLSRKEWNDGRDGDELSDGCRTFVDPETSCKTFEGNSLEI